MLVRVPPGCLLLQAGRQLEWLTGGHVRAGWHEVVVTEATSEAVARASAAGHSLWRVSSTVFSHVASAQVLRPLGRFGEQPGAAQAYPPTEAGVQVQRELEAISLRKGGGDAHGCE
jgi:isopenicillin N synthase-like dioxygenase